MKDLLPLQFASAGSAMRVRHVSGNAHAVHRLHELGLREGTLLQVVQSGTPCIVQLDGHRLAVRNDDGVMVLVGPATEAKSPVSGAVKVAR